jgi:hypothetical protein
MNIEYSFSMKAYKTRRKNAHKAGKDDQIDVQTGKFVLLCWHAKPQRALDDKRRTAIMDKQYAVVPPAQRFDESFEIASIAAREDGESSHGQARPRRKGECLLRTRYR